MMRSTLFALLFGSILGGAAMDAAGFALQPHQMEEDLNKAFGKRRQKQPPAEKPAPQADLDATMKAAQKAEEDLQRLAEEDAQRDRLAKEKKNNGSLWFFGGCAGVLLFVSLAVGKFALKG